MLQNNCMWIPPIRKKNQFKLQEVIAFGLASGMITAFLKSESTKKVAQNQARFKVRDLQVPFWRKSFPSTLPLITQRLQIVKKTQILCLFLLSLQKKFNS